MKLLLAKPEGMAWFDATLCKLGRAQPGDILVIRYGGGADKGEALALAQALFDASKEMPHGTFKHPIPIVTTHKDIHWAMERLKSEYVPK